MPHGLTSGARQPALLAEGVVAEADVAETAEDVDVILTDAG